MDDMTLGDSVIPRNIPMGQLLLMYLGAAAFGYLVVTLACIVFAPRRPIMIGVPVDIRPTDTPPVAPLSPRIRSKSYGKSRTRSK